jgi:hypothetical protein
MYKRVTGNERDKYPKRSVGKLSNKATKAGVTVG